MATLSTSTFRTSARLRAHWHRFRLDMTPMVDVAFLLLTFFMITTRPHVLQLMMPKLTHPGYSESNCGFHRFRVATVILGQNHQLYYYVGYYGLYGSEGLQPVMHTTNFSSQGIRCQLLAWRSQLPTLPIFIKPGPHATYRDMVDILDEMNITDQSRYALMKLNATDHQLLLANGKQ